MNFMAFLETSSASAGKLRLLPLNLLRIEANYSFTHIGPRFPLKTFTLAQQYSVKYLQCLQIFKGI